MIEREIKILNIKPKKLIKKIKNLGGKHLWQGHITDWYFISADGSKSSSKTRLRKIYTAETGETQTYITFKQKYRNIRTVKACQELELLYTDFAGAWLGLESAGLRFAYTKNKQRISYMLDENNRCDIDIYEHIPPLCEIEGPDESSIHTRVQTLGYSSDDTSIYGYKGLMKHYGMSISV